ncbi:MAG TPA: type II toxin-antitoxin system PemK/MazF family toxin, partial [Candidatus Baltobacteraceae bacterium]|nr:type II toxin-antitoxin system PemK/MazF family toxin [Candidatus Baltobacteraceae bacterium]
DLLLAAITSQIPNALAPDEFLIPSAELAACGLPKPSVVRLLKLVALHKSLIVKRIGSLPEQSLNDISRRIHELI